jgi:RNA polymerase sigma-70 factor (ECF subfamily)
MPTTLDSPSRSAARIRSTDLAREFPQQHARLLGIARRYFPGEADCADVVQDAYLAALRNLHRFRGQSSLGTWLHRIVVNACLMKLRSQSRRNMVAWDDNVPVAAAASAPETPWTDDLRQPLRQALGQLDEKYRTVIRLRYFEGFSTAQTAELLGTTRDAVKVRLHRGRRSLRALLARAAGLEC